MKKAISLTFVIFAFLFLGGTIVYRFIILPNQSYVKDGTAGMLKVSLTPLISLPPSHGIILNHSMPYVVSNSNTTLSPHQIKATYTYYIRAISFQNKPKVISLTPSDTGKTFTADVGDLIILFFDIRINHFTSTQSSPQKIFINPGGLQQETIHLPNGAMGAYRVYRAGTGTIQVIEEK